MIKKQINTLMGLMLFVNMVACAKDPECDTDNAALAAMQRSVVTFLRADGSSMEIAVKVADNNETRAAGFQRVCESTIVAEPILFLFQHEFIARFHMNNVVAPIDIAFIDKQGVIESIQSMRTYEANGEKPTYGSRRPVTAALEVHKGFFKKHNLGVDSKLTWQTVN